MIGEILGIPPKPTAASQPFWDACQAQRLILPRCRECTRLFFYPRIHCPHCGSQSLDWQQASGSGRVFSFTHVAVSFHGRSWDSQLPYTVILVDLDEGPRMLSRLLGDDRDAVRGGDAVQVMFPDIGGQRVPMFCRAAATTKPPEDVPC